MRFAFAGGNPYVAGAERGARRACRQARRRRRNPAGGARVTEGAAMLVLSRKLGERVRIAGGVVVEVLEIRGRRIRLGFDAPPEVAIWREELPPLPRPAPAARGPNRKSV
jgi:carbon storage regulator